LAFGSLELEKATARKAYREAGKAPKVQTAGKNSKPVGKTLNRREEL
jgi:hypothetical protein